MLSLKGKFWTDSYNVRNMLGIYVYVLEEDVYRCIDAQGQKVAYCFYCAIYFYQETINLAIENETINIPFKNKPIIHILHIFPLLFSTIYLKYLKYLSQKMICQYISKKL